MKFLKPVIFVFVASLITFHLSSCLVVHGHHDNGKHKGWYKSKGGVSQGNKGAKAVPMHPGKGHGKHKK
jgi:hypothetical protein